MERPSARAVVSEVSRGRRGRALRVAARRRRRENARRRRGGRRRRRRRRWPAVARANARVRRARRAGRRERAVRPTKRRRASNLRGGDPGSRRADVLARARRASVVRGRGERARDASTAASFSMQTRRGGVHVTPNSGGGAGAHAAAAMSYRSLATPAALARTRALEPFFRVDRSGVHGMGVFTTVALPGREMIMEYKGEIVRRPIADRREAAERAAIARRAKDAADSAARRGDPPPPPLSEVRSISHWFPNDRVGVVNADP
eukprot:31318-Pelagococcus_subviridis.AAC.10